MEAGPQVTASLGCLKMTGLAGEDISEGMGRPCRDTNTVTSPCSTLGQKKGFGIYSSFCARPSVDLKLGRDGKCFTTLDRSLAAE